MLTALVWCRMFCASTATAARSGRMRCARETKEMTNTVSNQPASHLFGCVLAARPRGQRDDQHCLTHLHLISLVAF